jgi:fibronectin-binding autotransporter adhesin
MGRPVSFLAEALESRALFSAAQPLPYDIALIDSTLPDAQLLIDAALGNTRVIAYDGATESAREVLGRVVASAAAGGRQIASLSIFSHGLAGRFRLGNDWISAGDLAGTAAQWRDLRAALAPGASVQIYGCDTADGVSGHRLLGELSRYTGTAVFGSTNITGHDGDWTLEVAARPATAAAPADARLPLSLGQLAGYTGDLIWTGATTGTTNNAAHNYNNIANWAGGVIDDSFAGVTLTGGLTLYMSAARTTGASGLNLGYSGNYDLTIESSSTTAQTLTLGGNETGDFGGANNRTVTLGNTTDPVNVDLNGATTTFTVTGAGDTLNIIGTVANGGLTKAGSGTLELGGTNTYSGGTIVNAGVLQAYAATVGTVSATPTTLGSTASTVTVNSGATLWLDYLVSGGAVCNVTYAYAIGGAGTLEVTAPGSNASDTSLLSGNLSGLTGILDLFPYSGAVGKTQLSGTTAGYQPSSSTVIKVESGTTLFSSSGLTYGCTIQLYSTGDSENLGALRLEGGSTASGSIVLMANASVGSNTGAATVSGVISDGGNGYSLTKQGNGSIALSNSNTFTGGTTLSAGTLAINNPAAIGTGTFTINGGTIDNTSGAAVTLSNNNAQTWAGNFTFTGSNALNLGTGPVTLGASRTVTGSASTLTVGGAIGDGGSGYAVTKAGAGALALAGANTFGGGTTLSAGTLDINSATAIGTGTFTVSGGTIDNTSGTAVTLSTNNAQNWGGNFTFTGSNALNLGTGPVTLGASRTVTASASTLTVGGAIGDGGGGYAVIKAGAGALALAGANTFGGGVTLSAGTLDVNNAAALGTGTFTVNGGTIDNTSGAAVTDANNNAQVWGGNFTFTGTNDLSMGTGAVTMAASRTILITAGNLTVGGNIAGGANSLITGYSGRLILSGTNTLGSITIGNTSGLSVLRATSNGALGTGTVNINGGGGPGTLELSGGVTVSNAISFDGHASGNVGIESVSGNNTVSGPISIVAGGSYYPIQSDTGSNVVFSNATVLSGVLGGRTVNLQGTGTGTISGSITGTAVVVKKGTGTWTLAGSNSFAGGLTLSAGTLNMNSATAPGTGAITFSGGTLDNTSGAAVTLTGNDAQTWSGNLAFTGTNDLNLGTGNVTLTAGRTVTTSAGTLTVGGTIDDGGSGYAITKAGAGTLALGGSSTYSGGTVVNAGVLQAYDAAGVTSAITPAPLGSTASTATVNAGATLWLDYLIGSSSADVTYAYAFAGAGTLEVTAPGNSGSTTSILSGNLGGLSGTLDLFPNAGNVGKTLLASSTAGYQPSSTATIKVESGTTLDVASGLAYGSNIQVFSTGNSEGLGALRVESGSTLSGSITLMANSSVGSNAGVGTISGVISDGGNGYSLTEQAGATIVLSNANTYSGGTTVSSGTLLANNATGSGTGTGAVTVSSGATFGGTGAVTGSVTASSGGTISPGNAGPSSFATGNLTVPSGATFAADVNSSTAGTGYDQTNVTGTVNLTGGTLSLSGTRAVDGGDAITLIQNDGSDAVTGTFNGLAEGAIVTLNGVRYTISYQGGTGNDVVLTDASPTLATAAAATPTAVAGTTSALSVLGASSAGESTLTYTWAATTAPVGASPTFSANGTNAAKASTVTFNAAGSYTFTVTVSDVQGNTATSAVSVTVAQTLTTVTASPATASLNETATQQFAATGYDQFGSSMTSQPAFTWTLGSGAGSISGAGLYTAPGSAGTATVTATSGAVTGSATVTVTNAPPTVATAAAASPTSVTGTTTALSVLGADDNGEPNLTYTWAATTKPAGSNPTFSANGTNAAKASTATFDQAGSYTFTVTISDGQGGTVTSAVSVTVAQTLTTITLTPATASLNEDATQQFAATGFDQFAVVMASQPTFTWAQGSGVGSISGAGLYTAPGSSGTATVTATSGAVTGSATVTVTNAAPTVATAAAASPTTVTAATTALSVLAADDNGEPNLTYTWAATTKPMGSNPTFSANGTNAAKASTATFDQAGSYAFTVTISDGQGGTVTSAVSVTVAQTLASIAVTPATASLNEDATQQFSATGYDQFGTSMASQPTVTWSKASGTGSVGGTGLYTAPAAAGTATVQATSGSVTGTAAVTVTNAAPTVAAAAAASPTTVTGTTTALSVLGADDNGESNLTYTWAATASPVGPSPSFSANGTNAAQASTATFDSAGSYTFTVTIIDGQGGMVTSAVSVTVAQTLTSITVSPATASLNEDQTQQLAATGYDQFGTSMASQPTLAWAVAAGVGSVDGSGVYTSPASAGTASVTATSGAVTGSATVTVTNAAPTVATAAAASPATVTGTTSALSVLGADDNGEPNLAYTWAATTKPVGSNPTFSANGTNAAKASIATFNSAGSYTFTVTISDGQGGTVTSAVSVAVSQTLTTISVTPTTASLNEDATQQFAAVGYDQFAMAVASQPTFTWAEASGTGSVSGTGFYTAPAAAGTATVQATSGSVNGSATVTVTNAAPTVATAAAASPTSVAGTTTALSVLGADDNGEPNLTYTWAATTKPVGSNPTFSANGTDAAQASTVTFNLAGSYTFTVTISDGQGGTVTSAASVTVAQTLATITVTPTTASSNEDATQQFAATGYDQFGTSMASQPAFTWAKASGIGSVSGTGLYTAPAAAGTATVQATSGSVNGTAAVTVTNAAPTVATAAAASPTTVTGSTTALSVLGADDNGEPNLTYTWAATTKPVGSNPTFSANGTNGARASTATFDLAGSYTFTVTISDGQGGTVTSAVSVTVAQTLATITVSPATASLNEDATRQFAATAYDQFAVAMASQPTLTWAKVSGTGSVSGTGLYTAPDAAGSATVQATSGSVSGSATVTVTDAAPTVATAAAASPTSVTGITTALSVLGADDNGESNLTYTWAATTKPAGSSPTFSANGTNAAKASTVTFDRAGSYTFTVTIDDGQGGTVASAVNVAVAQALATVVVTPGTASLNEDAAQQFTAVAYDQFGVAMVSQPAFAWAVASGVGSVDGAGAYTAPASAGTATVTATSGSVTGSATVTVSNATPTVATAAAATPGPVAGTTTTLSVLGADDNGEPNLNYTWAATVAPVGANPAFSANGTNAAKGCTIRFDAAGAYTFTVTIDDGQGGTVTSAVGVTVDQTLTTITVTPATASLNEDATRQFTATGHDQFGAPMASQPTFAWGTSAGTGTVGGTGLYNAPAAAGTATVTATSGAVTGSAAVTVTNAAPTVATAAAALPMTVTGATTALSVLGADDNGEPNLTYTWAVTAKPVGSSPVFSANGTNAARSDTVTFDAAGSYTFTVTISDGQGGTVTSAVGVAVYQTLTSITVTPATASLNENGTQPFAATGHDQFGVAMSSQPAFAWAVAAGVGLIDGSGLYTAPGNAGTAMVIATSGSVTGSAAVTVTDAAPTIAVAAAVTPSPVTGTTTALSVLGADDNGEANLTYTWAATTAPVGASPTFSANGTNGAKASAVTFDRAGGYTFTVTIDDGQGGTATSAVSVSVDQALTGITVAPATTTVHENQTQQLVATGDDQFGEPMAVQPALAWAVVAGAGSVDASGLYTAPSVAGAATVTATCGSVATSASITVSNAAPTVATAAAASPSTVTATTAALSVLGADDNGEPNLTYTWAATTRPAGASPTFSDDGTNSAKGSTVTFDRAGGYTFTVTIGDGQGGTVTSSVGVTVAQTLTTVAVTPGATGVNLNGTRSFAAVGYDQFGLTMVPQPTFAWDLASGVGGIDPTTGIYTAGSSAGSAVVRATGGSVAGTASVTVIDAAPTVATAAAASPASVTGTTTDLSVLGADDGGESNLTYAWSMTAGPAGAAPTFSANGAHGAKASTVTFDAAGGYTFAVTISDGTNAVTSSVNVAVAQTLAAAVVGPSTAALDLNGSRAFSAVGYDQFGAAMAAQPAFAWSVASGVGSVGAATGVYTAGATAGTAVIRATSGGVTAAAGATVTDAAPTVALAAAANPGAVTGTSTALSVLGADDGGEPNLTYTWTATAAPAGATPAFSANGTNGAKATTVTFDRAGAYTFRVAIVDAGGNTAISSASVVVAQTVTSVDVTPAAVTLAEDGTRQFSAVVYDQFGDAVASQPVFTWDDPSGVGSIDGSGLYTAPAAAGSATIRAADGPVIGSATVTIDNDGPTVAIAASASPATVTGTTTALSVLGADDGGEPRLTYAWAVTSGPAGATFSANGTNGSKHSTVTFAAAGSYTFQVTIADAEGRTTSSSVGVTVGQALTAILVAPSTAGLELDVSRAFGAVGYDQFGTPLSSQPNFTWSVASGVGAIDPTTGVYASGATAGTAVVTATAGPVVGTATLTVTNAAPTLAVAATALPAPAVGTTTTLSVLGADDGGESNLTYTWSVASVPSGGGAAFAANGTNAAKDTAVTFDAAGRYTFAVAVSDGTSTVTGTVNVLVSQTLTTIAVTPSTATVTDGQTVQFAAAGYDQFGDALASQPAFDWRVASGGGSVTAAGLFTATGAAAVEIAATVGPASGSAAVSVTEPVSGAISGLVAQVGVGGVRLTWRQPAGAYKGAIVERSTDGQAWTAIAVVDGSTTTFVDRTATAATTTTYQYRAVAFQVESGSRVDSAASNVAAATLTRIPMIVPSSAPGGPPGPTAGNPQPLSVPEVPPVPPAGGGEDGVRPATATASDPTGAEVTDASDPAAAKVPEPTPFVAPAPPSQAPVPPADAPAHVQKPSDPANPDGEGPAPAVVASPPIAAPNVPTTQAIRTLRITVPAAYRAIARRTGTTSAVAAAARAAKAADVRRRRAGAVVAAAVTAVAAGSLLWMVQGGALLATALTALPFWRWVDPLPVLDAWEQDARRRRDGRRRRRPGDPPEDDERELGNVID